jgi:hypothetical protein
VLAVEEKKSSCPVEVSKITKYQINPLIALLEEEPPDPRYML